MVYLPHFGFNLDKDANSSLKRGTEGRIDNGTGPQIWVVPTDEEGRIAKETHYVVEHEVEQATAKSLNLKLRLHKQARFPLPNFYYCATDITYENDFIGADREGVGLTSACLGLVYALECQGVKAGFVKPFHRKKPGNRSHYSTLSSFIPK